MSDGAIGPPDPETVRRFREREAKAAPLRQMLQEQGGSGAGQAPAEKQSSKRVF